MNPVFVILYAFCVLLACVLIACAQGLGGYRAQDSAFMGLLVVLGIAVFCWWNAVPDGSDVDTGAVLAAVGIAVLLVCFIITHSVAHHNQQRRTRRVEDN